MINSGVCRPGILIEDHFAFPVGGLASFQFRVCRTQANIQRSGYFDRGGVLAPHPFKLFSILQRKRFHIESPLSTVSMSD